MSYEDCLRKNLIKKDLNVKDRVLLSLKTADRFLEEANGNFKIKYYDVCELLCYSSCFHAARALLFSKGYTERSHVCLIEALFHLFDNDHELNSTLSSFDQLRLSRHNIQYDGALVSEEKAKEVLKFTENFIKAARKRLK